RPDARYVRGAGATRGRSSRLLLVRGLARDAGNVQRRTDVRGATRPRGARLRGGALRARGSRRPPPADVRDPVPARAVGGALEHADTADRSGVAVPGWTRAPCRLAGGDREARC